MARIKKAKTIDELKSLSEKDIRTAKEKAEQKTTAAVKVGTVNCDNLRLREEPNTESNIIKLFQKGDEVEILDNANEEFYRVNGGFVMKKFIDEE